MKDIPDLQAERDHRLIPIDKVGVKGVRYPIIVDDQVNGSQHTIAVIDLYVGLHHSKRGTHMSRFLEVLNRYHQDNLINNLESMLGDLKTTLKANTAYASLSFPYFIERHAPVSKISSLMDYQCEFSASLEDSFTLWIGVKVPVTTLCPCSKEVSDFGAHNQRSFISIRTRYQGFVWLEELINIAENMASSPIYPLLKRRDEKFVTEAAYSRPRFVEDIVREITLVLEKDNRILEFYVESENLESIHNHNAYAVVYRELNR